MLKDYLRPVKNSLVDLYLRCHRINQRPVFVLGNQKSGTSAICWLLAEASGETLTLDVTRSIADPEWQVDVFNGDLPLDKWINRYRYEFSRKIIKEPALSLFTEQLIQKYPEAQFLYIVRDPRDNIRSILNRVNVSGEQLNDKTISPDHVNNGLAWQRILDSDWITGKPTDSMVESLAYRWCYLNEQYLKHKESIHFIRYEDFRADKETKIYELVARLGLEKRNGITDKVDVQKQPKGDNSLTWEDFFGASLLEKVNRITHEQRQIFGYTNEG